MQKVFGTIYRRVYRSIAPLRQIMKGMLYFCSMDVYIIQGMFVCVCVCVFVCVCMYVCVCVCACMCMLTCTCVQNAYQVVSEHDRPWEASSVERRGLHSLLPSDCASLRGNQLLSTHQAVLHILRGDSGPGECHCQW